MPQVFEERFGRKRVRNYGCELRHYEVLRVTGRLRRRSIELSKTRIKYHLTAIGMMKRQLRNSEATEACEVLSDQEKEKGTIDRHAGVEGASIQ